MAQDKSYIRLAGARDLEAVNELLRDVLRVHHAGRPDLFKGEGKKYTDEELLKVFANPNTPVFVYEKEGAVLGYIFCSIQVPSADQLNPVKTLYIDDLCVNGKARGQHIGKKLFEHVCQAASDMGCYEISLNVWEGNDAARKFYENMGFKPKSTTMEFILK